MNKIIICICVFFLASSCITKENIKKDAYRCVIQKTYQDKSNHYVFSFLFSTSEGTSKEIAELFPYSWKYAEVGDSIIKEKGDLYIRIKGKW